MPVVQGTFVLRYGYSLLNNPALGTINRIYSYQNQNAGIRRLIYCAGTAVDVSNEDGTGLASITTSVSSAPRMVNSRDYAFFPALKAATTWPSGQKTDGKKWHSTNGLSDLGLAVPAAAVNVTSTLTAGNITLASTVGRVYAGAFRNSTTGHYSDLNVGVGSFASGTVTNLPTSESITSNFQNNTWTNITNVQAEDGVVATCTFSGTASTLSDLLNATGFGFTIPSTATIYGVQVTVKKAQPTGPAGAVLDNTIQLIKGGTPSGTNKADTVNTWQTALTNAFYGGASDLWGLTLTPADVNAANFGVTIAANGTTGFGVTGTIDVIKITITYATGAGANTGVITSKQVSLSLPTATPPTGADQFAILATLDGGDINTFYLLDIVPVAQTTYTDNTPDNVLVTKNRATEVDDFGVEHGLINNQPPPLKLQFPTKHRGRIYGAIGENLYFSKNLDEITTSTGLVLGRYEEAWPLTYSLPVSTEEESIRGLLSDGNILYIGTERHIWRLDGDGPLNFSKPEVIFNEVGIVNQDVWDIGFAEGQPVGMLWLTPDNRVILSNFSTYQDIGTPIQDLLNTINSSATNGPWGHFFSQGSYDLYILAIPTNANTSPDTLCIYDLRSRKWCIWTCADTFTTGRFNINASGTPQWLMAASTGKVYQFVSSATQDRVNDTPVNISASLKTSWLHLGEPAKIKVLNWLEAITGDVNMTVTVEGATTSAQAISSPRTVVSNGALVTSPEGRLRNFLAGKPAKDRFYRFTFNSSGGVKNILQGYQIEADIIPL